MRLTWLSDIIFLNLGYAGSFVGHTSNYREERGPWRQLGHFNLMFCFSIDNRGGRRDWKLSTHILADARHDHVTRSKFANTHNIAISVEGALFALAKGLVHLQAICQMP